ATTPEADGSMLCAMNALRLSAAAALTVAAFVASATAGVGCWDNTTEIWICLDPVTGKESNRTYDANHYVNGVFDPCHCYDPGGPSKSCPDEVDAGPDAP